MKINNLTISGFGKFNKAFTVDFSKNDIQVIVGKNEAGKSTILQAILATIFGLTSNDRKRFEPWSTKTLAKGSITLSNKDSLIEIDRDFKTDNVTFIVQSKGKKKTLFSDTDRAGSRGERSYIKILSKYIPVTDPDVFKNTTFLEQDQIGVQIPASLKYLITGSPEMDIDKILDTLVDDYFNITCKGDFIGRAKKSKNRLLEELEDELYKKKHSLENLKIQLNTQKTLQSEINSLDKDIVKTNNKIESLSHQSTIFQNLSEYLEQEKRLKETHKEIYQQKNRVEKIEKEIKDTKSKLDTKFPRLKIFTGLELQKNITNWINIIDKRDHLEKELKKVQSEKEQALEKIEKKYNIYKEVGVDFIYSIKRLRDLKEKENLKKYSINKNLEDKSKLDQLFSKQKYQLITGATLLSIITGILLQYLNLPFSNVLWISALLFIIISVASVFMVLYPKQNNINNIKIRIDIIKTELSEIDMEIEKIKIKYENIENIDKINHHLTQYDLYETEVKNIDKLKAKEKLITEELGDYEMQKTIDRFETKYGNFIDIYEEDLKGRIDELIHLQQQYQNKNDALKTHKNREDIENREYELSMEISRVQSNLESTIMLNPELTKITKDIPLLNEKILLLKEEIEILSVKRHEFETLIHNKKIILAGIESNEDIDIEQILEDLKQLEEQIKYTTLKKKALILAIETLESSIEEYNQLYSKSLNSKLNQYLSKIAGHKNFVVELDDRFDVAILHEEKKISEDSLSTGTRDQFYLALRLAFSREIAEENNLPFFLDDPFVNCDNERLKRILNILREINKEHQVVLFTNDDKYKKWTKHPIILDS